MIRVVGRLLLLSALAAATLPAYGRDGDPRFAIGTGIGFVEDSFLLSFEAPISIDRDFSLGPLVQLGFENKATLVMASVTGRYRRGFDELFDVATKPARRTHLFGQAGVGISHLAVDRKKGADGDDTAALIHLGGGVDYELTPRLSATSHMLFNIHAGDLFGDSFSFSWQVIGLRYAF